MANRRCLWMRYEQNVELICNPIPKHLLFPSLLNWMSKRNRSHIITDDKPEKKTTTNKNETAEKRRENKHKNQSKHFYSSSFTYFYFHCFVSYTKHFRTLILWDERKWNELKIQANLCDFRQTDDTA